MQPNANVVTDGYSVRRDVVKNAEGDIIKWLENIKK